jgi:hypothetical protein
MLVSPDGEVTITNDGATILDKMVSRLEACVATRMVMPVVSLTHIFLYLVGFGDDHSRLVPEM